jgi:hypothetical protein
MDHEMNMVEEAMRTFKYLAIAGGSDVDLLVALVLLKERVNGEIDAALDLQNELGEGNDE